MLVPKKESITLKEKKPDKILRVKGGRHKKVSDSSDIDDSDS